MSFWEFLKLFCKQFFDIGKRSGSIIREAFNLFRTFQRISATKSFSARLSTECLSMFQWANELIQIIATNLFNVRPFSNYELFSIYAMVFPITILTFIASLEYDDEQKLSIILCPILFITSAFVGAFFVCPDSFQIIAIIGFSLGLLVLVITIIVYCRRRVKKEKKNEEEKEKEKDPFFLDSFIFTKVFFKTGIVFLIMMIPFCLFRYKFQLLIISIISILVFIIIMLELVYLLCDLELICYLYGIFSLLGELITLLIIPASSKFAQINQTDKYYNSPVNILAFIVSLILPIVMILLLLFINREEESKLYNNPLCCNIPIYLFHDLIDNLRQIAYAICAAYNKPWACIGLEVSWILLIIALLPYKKKSEYALAFGNSIVMFMSNGAAIYAETHGTKIFGFKLTVIFIIFACIPSLLAILLYFIFDFETEMDERIKNDDNRLFLLYYIALYGLPVFLIIYGFMYLRVLFI